jgi:hypothetical protein
MTQKISILQSGKNSVEAKNGKRNANSKLVLLKFFINYVNWENLFRKLG